MRQPLSDYDVWSFQKPDPDSWSWRRTSPDGEVLLEGRTTFPTIEDCMADARRNGYTGSFSLVP
jgi:hypothetical protein